MTYSVLLVQRGISANNHPVTGKSKKLYGQALQSPAHGGVAFSMSLTDYMSSAHDLIGNTEANQQWVPEFVVSSSPVSAHKCDRCPKPATAIWNNFYYCDDHAPNNATYLDGSSETVGSRTGAAAPPKPADVPKVDESISPGVTDNKGNPELPREDMAPPSIGTAREDAERIKEEGQTSEVPLPPQMRRKPDAKPPEAEPTPASEEKAKTVIAAITDGVIAAVMPKLDEIIESKMAGTKATKPKKKAPKAAPAPTEFQRLQKRAAQLSINSFGKKAEQLRREIADKAAAS